MEKTRTALVACVDNTEGAWAFLKGNEKGIRVSQLADGERVLLEVKASSPGIPGEKHVFDEEGSFPFGFQRFNRYRVGKTVRNDSIPKPTTVEILLNGRNLQR